MAEGVDPGQASEAGRLAQKSAEAFDLAAEAAADPSFKETKLEEAQELAGDSALAAAYTHLQQIVGSHRGRCCRSCSSSATAS